ncbi:MAG TPA: amino acid adenylation domain-containing protein, partial [Thermoanaerobaculia bacterium]|nr:amino acid adenylation domain-containing protein [Thermoanaerobaculia bacterium]
SLGVGADVLVGLCAERSPEMLVGVLAVLRAGGAYVPLDPSYPRERLAMILEDARPGVLLTQERLLPELPGSVALTVCLDDPSLAGEVEAAPAAVAAESLAYVLFTSGSTGRPKGVQISRGALLNFLRSVEREPGLAAGDVLLAVTTLAFDIAALELLLPLLVGARIALASREEAADAARLRGLLASSGATAMQATPATWRMLLDAGWQGNRGLRALCGGEALPTELAARLLPRVGSLWNLYGPTETTVWSAVGEVKAAAGEPLSAIAIGRPLANTTLYLVDRYLQSAPVGVPGELCIGGAGLARGYLGRPDLTAERFLPDPFASAGATGGARLYRTGDLARRRADGGIDFLGRIDNQVKVRGFRIELGEIEAALARHPAVRQAVVVVAEGTAAGGAALAEKNLQAYLVGEPAVDPVELRTFLGRQLPGYMIPTGFVFLQALPLTPNGKVDRRALARLGLAPDRAAKTPFVAPRTATEKRVAEIWAGLLGVERVSVNDDFFALGGHSLMGTRLVSRLRDAFEVEVPLRGLFEAPTVALLAFRIEAASWGERSPQPPPFQAVPWQQAPPLSFAQERLWFLAELDPGSAAYNISAAFRLAGALDLTALALAFQEIVRRHEVLRTTFGSADGRPVQVIDPRATVSLPLLDLSGMLEAGRTAEVERLAAAETLRPFDLLRGPLLRVLLLRLSAREHAGLFVLHHIVSDAWSLGILVEEVAALYGAFVVGRPSPLPELPIQYIEYAVRQREWLAGEVLEAQIAYWKKELAGVPEVLELPADRPRPPLRTGRGASQPVSLPGTLLGELGAFGQRRGATLFMALLAGFQALLHRYTDQWDIVVGSPIANRTRTEVEGLIGLFVNTLALRGRVSDAATAQELLAGVRTTALSAYAHQDLPFEKLIEELRVERSLRYSPLFQVVFVLQNAPLEPLDLPGLILSPLDLPVTQAKFDLTLTLAETAAALAGSIEYSTDLFEAATVRRLIGHLQVLLEGMAADGERRVAELPLLTAGERHQLVAGWSEGPAEALFCLHQRFAAQAAARPGAVAVRCGEESLTYGELDRRANRLARFLAGAGVLPGELVGLCLDRSLEMVVAILAVLKAGGAYLPLDPTYPPERLAFSLADSRVRVLVTEERLEGLAGQGPIHVVRVDADRKLIARESGESLSLAVAPEMPAYVIYTSGSTGRPKGVEVSHASVARLFTATEPWFGFGADEVWTLFHSYAFDFSVWELWGALLYGGRLVVVPYLVSRSPEAFYGLLDRERVTVLNQTPSAFRQLVWAEGEALAGALPDLALRWVVFGGEALELQSLAPWFARRAGTSGP